MRDEPIFKETTNNLSTPKKPGIWTRFWKAYEEKKHTDQSFRATMITIQIGLVACVVLIAVLFMVKGQSLGSSFLPGRLR